MLARDVRLERGKRARSPSRARDAPGAALRKTARGLRESLPAEDRRRRGARQGDPDAAHFHPRHRHCRRCQSPPRHRSAARRGGGRRKRRFQPETGTGLAAFPVVRKQSTRVRRSRPESSAARHDPNVRRQTRAKSRRSAPDRIRTCDLRFRRPTLYPTELRARGASSVAVAWRPWIRRKAHQTTSRPLRH